MLLPLLQTRLIPQRDIGSILIFFAVIFLFSIIIFIGQKVTGKGSKNHSVKFNQKNFRKTAKRIGLNRQQTNLLLKMVKLYDVKHPYHLLSNSGLFDSILKRVINNIEHSNVPSPQLEKRKNMLYQIKQILERHAQSRSKLKSTRQLHLGQHVILSPEGQGKFHTKIAQNSKKYLGLLCPTHDDNTPVRWKKNTLLKVFADQEQGIGYLFTSKVLGYKSADGVATLAIKHSDTMKLIHKRKHRRKDLQVPAFFYPVSVQQVNTESGPQKRATVDSKNHKIGTLVDISAGGCGIRTLVPLKQGQLLKVVFEKDRNNPITAFGKVVKLHRMANQSFLMHVQFTKVSLESTNRINDFIYSIHEDYHSGRRESYY
ncbi:MAG: PilZ domain-containing protein [Spirochaetia bacterium]